MNTISSVWEPRNVTTRGGFQTTNKLFSDPSSNMRTLKKILEKEIYSFKNDIKNNRSVLIENWPKKIEIDAWYVRILKSGHQSSHIHPSGWISGVLYLKTVELPKQNEGAIEFSLNGEHYSNVNSPKLIHQPKLGDIVFFPSSLHHRTVPFSTNADRIIVSFDLKPK